ncbi:MAG: TatD family hydrolase [Clostridia bacterium]|nr:TatD family hydrolase [Clostridia bacterium]
MLFDTHAHLNDSRFDDDREQLIESLNSSGVGAYCEIGYDMPSSVKAAQLADKYSFVYAAVGVHPHDSKDMTNEDLPVLADLYAKEKVVAIGEIGLDYYYDNSDREVQREWFARQLDLAKSIDAPVVIHSRDAMEDTINILKSHGNGDGIIHCYSGSKESARILLDMGYYISFAGPVTFKNAVTALEVIDYVPLDRILVETDSPYLAPVPYRGKRNCPVYVAEVARKIAEIKGMTFEEISKITFDNAMRIYRLDKSSL